MLVETVGVGQSETMVAEMTDIFVLLIAPGGGDELQGVKRGIMEMADLILVNKADGDLARRGEPHPRRLCRRAAPAAPEARRPAGFPRALTVSALTGAGLAEAWAAVEALAAARQASGAWDARRRTQAEAWFAQRSSRAAGPSAGRPRMAALAPSSPRRWPRAASRPTPLPRRCSRR